MLVVGSQKALMMPPGLAFVTVSPKAWERIDAREATAYYFDLKHARKSMKTFDNPWTPAVTLIVGLKKAIDMINDRGIEQIWEDHKRLARATRAGAKALGLELLAEQPSDSVTAIKLPDDLDGAALVKNLRIERGITIAGGQAQLRGKICRISHMGYTGDYDVIIAISGLEMILAEMGYQFEIGAGVSAVEKALAGQE